NREGDCLAAMLRPGNVHSAEDWDELLLPEIARQQQRGKEVVFRADAAFAKPEIYEALEESDVCDPSSRGQPLGAGHCRVADRLAAAVGQDRRAFGETCPVLLALAGRGASDTVPVRGNGAADRGAAGARGIAW